LGLIINGKKTGFFVETKNELRKYQLYQIKERYHKSDNILIIAGRIFPKIKEELRKNGKLKLHKPIKTF